MSKFFYDLEFLEGKQKLNFWQRLLSGKKESMTTIDLISIGIVQDDGREYYAVSKDFNLKEAWNRYDVKIDQVYGDMRNRYPDGIKTKVYWIRDNVLHPIFDELAQKDAGNITSVLKTYAFTYKNLKKLINWYGKSREQIADEIQKFIYCGFSGNYNSLDEALESEPIQFYGYYPAYDHVGLCWLYNRMIDLPKGFPMFTIDLKQMLDEMLEKKIMTFLPACKGQDEIRSNSNIPLKFKLKWFKSLPDYPKETNAHSAIYDARWNYELYQFILCH